MDELRRYFDVTDSGQRRVAVAGLEIGGQLVRAGDGVIAHGLFGSRDAPVFPHPDRLDLSRNATNHITFGFGPHRCVGGTLPGTQLQVVHGTRCRRIPTLPLAIPFDQVPFRHDMPIHGFHGLPMTW